MHTRPIVYGLLAAILWWSVATDAKSADDVPAAAPNFLPLAPDTIVRIHWLGKRRLGVAAGAYNLMRIWSLPSSLQLEGQTLNNLATAPWRLMSGGNIPENVPAGALRPLLDDVVREESWFEIRQPADQKREMVFAIKLDDQRAGVWRTNLAVVAASLAGVQTMEPEGHGWSIEKPDAPGHYELRRVAGWTLFGVSAGGNSLLTETIANISQKRDPLPGVRSNDWIEASIDLSRLDIPRSIAANFPDGLPKISVAINGDGASVITHAELSFPRPLPINFEPWHIPVERIHDPLTGFTALRGFKSLLAASKICEHLQLGDPPNQAFFWSLDDVPMQILAALPAPDAGNDVRALAGFLEEHANPWLAAHDRGNLEYNAERNGMVWTGVRSIEPYLFSRPIGDHNYILGGLVPGILSGTNAQTQVYDCPQFDDLRAQFSAQTNLVYFDWELTCERVDADLYLGQILRAMIGGPQLPMESPGLIWLGNIKARLAGSTTAVTATGSNDLSFYRRATLGFTGAELHLLVDWLSSPQFPRGFYTTLAKP